jgi:predicted aspartyl protease
MTKEVANIRMKILSIQGDGNHCFINVKINNGIKVRLILDTGASRSVLDHQLIKELNLLDKMQDLPEKATGLGTNTMEGHLLKLDKLKIGKLVIKDYYIGILDLSHVNLSYQMVGLPAVQGALGSDILKEYGAEISFRDKRLKLFK